MDVVDLWWLSLAVFAVVVVVVALLLGLIIAAARRIDQHAQAIWTAGKQIAANTVSIWILDQTNQHLGKLLEEVRAITRAGESIEARLRGRDAGSGTR